MFLVSFLHFKKYVFILYVMYLIILNFWFYTIKSYNFIRFSIVISNILILYPEKKKFLSIQNTWYYFTIYIIPRKKHFFINTKYWIVFHYLCYTQKKDFFDQHKILNDISLLMLYPEKKLFFINTKYSIIFHYLYYTHKNIFLSTQNTQ